VSKFISIPGLPGTFPLESAGTDSGNTPHWKLFGTQTYNEENKWSVTLSETWISQGVQNRAYIQCTSGCPLPTVQNPTVNDNHMPGIYYINLGGTYQLSDPWQVYFQINNLLNKSPPVVYYNSQNPSYDGTNGLLYDVIGRMFHLGMRVTL
jgi:outer membrane receptor protein involved in Fe transport